MKRNLLGLVALALLLSGGLGLLMGYSYQSQAGMAAGVGVRAGLVLGALWIAWPQLLQLASSVPRWMLAAGGIAVLVLVVWGSKMIVLVLIAIAALALLHFAGRLLGR